MIHRGQVWCNPASLKTVIDGVYFGNYRPGEWQIPNQNTSERYILYATHSSLSLGRDLVDDLYWACGPNILANEEGLEYDQLISFGQPIHLDSRVIANADSVQKFLAHDGGRPWSGLLIISSKNRKIWRLERNPVLSKVTVAEEKEKS